MFKRQNTWYSARTVAAVTSPGYFPVWCHDCGKEIEEGDIIVLYARRHRGWFRTRFVTTLYCLPCFPLISHVEHLHPELKHDGASPHTPRPRERLGDGDALAPLTMRTDVSS